MELLQEKDTHEGGCSCGHVRYKILSKPFIVHCCHCSYCQRQSGTAFALNAIFDAKHVEVLQGEVENLQMPSPSGKGQTIARCPKCRVAVWSNYFMGGIDELIRFIRVGTLDNPNLLPPDIHIYTSTKMSWVILPPETPAVEDVYDVKEVWSPEAVKRRMALLEEANRNNS